MYQLKINKKYNFSNKNIAIGNSNTVYTICEINEFKRLLNLKKIKSKKEYFENILNSLNENNSHVLDYILSEKNKNDYLIYLKKEINFTKKYITNYFKDVLPNRLNLFNNIKTLKNCTKTIYDHNTVTGRLKVIDGTNFLTMKKEERYKLKHSDIKRKIYEIDFKSCEPNFYIKSQNIEIENNDIYNSIIKKFDLKADRKKFKRILLSMMYGADNAVIARISNIKESKIKEIKKYLKINKFKESLEKEYETYGFIKNYYGRPLLNKNNLVNHWIQSSSADFCCLSFNELIKNNKHIEIHGVIHDAVIVSTLSNIDLNYLGESISKIKIPITIECISNN